MSFDLILGSYKDLVKDEVIREEVLLPLRANSFLSLAMWSICMRFVGEEGWQVRFGKDTIRKLRESLGRLVGEPTTQLSPLLQGLEPYPDGWRASVRTPDTLPHYPMVLHRGGFPDGS